MNNCAVHYVACCFDELTDRHLQTSWERDPSSGPSKRKPHVHQRETSARLLEDVISQKQTDRGPFGGIGTMRADGKTFAFVEDVFSSGADEELDGRLHWGVCVCVCGCLCMCAC